MTSGPRRRFYKTASVEASGPGFEVTLDGRKLRTPLKRPLALPSRALAEAIAGEWGAQGERIDPRSMILTKLANTAIDRVAPDLDRVRDEITRFAGSDLVCYRAAKPPGLVQRQAVAWEAVLDWARTRLDAEFTVTPGIVHVAQPPQALRATRLHLESLSPWELAALHTITTLLGSALTALRLLDAAMTADEAWAAAHIDEDWQIEHWGEDEEARARRDARRAEFDGALRFAGLSRREPPR